MSDPHKEFWNWLNKRPDHFLKILRDQLGIRLWSRQEEIYYSAFEYPQTYVRTGNGVGKTWISGVIGCAFLLCYSPSVVVYIATKREQVKRQAWAHFRGIYNKVRDLFGSMTPPLILPRPLTESVTISEKDNWFATIWSGDEDDPEAFQGFHAPYQIFIVDEASGIKDTVREAIDRNLLSHNNHILATGNPVRRQGWFFRDQMNPPPGLNIIHVSSLESPNVVAGKEIIPGLITKEKIEEWREKYGEHSPFWQVSVLGEFPQSGDDSLIPWEDIEKAVEKPLAPDFRRLAIGVDPARYGGDSTVVCALAGDVVVELVEIRRGDTYKIVSAIESVCNRLGTKRLAIDASAPGWGPMDVLRRKGYRVIEFVSGSSPKDKVRYMNLKAEVGWSLRQRFKDGAISIPNHERLQWELGAWRYQYDTAKRIRIVDPHRSPDFADALLIAHWLQERGTGEGKIEVGTGTLTHSLDW